MKQLSKQKWILSTLLIAALGSQYYFSTTSKDLSSIDLASRVPQNEPEDSLIAISNALSVANTPAARPTSPLATTPATATTAATPAAAAVPVVAVVPPSVTEATSPEAPCADCVRLSRATAEKIKQILIEATQKKTTAVVAVEEPVVETAAEKRERLRKEKEDARLEKEQAKADKLQEQLEARNDEFRDKMEDIAARCKEDVSCSIPRFTSLLRRYSGTRAVDPRVAKAEFSSKIEKYLKIKLSEDINSTDTTSLEAMEKSEELRQALTDLSSDVPAEYSLVKTSLVSTVKQVTILRGAQIQNEFKQAAEFHKTNPNEFNQHYQAGWEAKPAFEANVSEYREAISAGLKTTPDSVTAEYVRTSFSPDLQRMVDGLKNASLLDYKDTTNNPLTNPAGGRGLVRGGGTTRNDIQLNDGKMTLPGAGNNVLNGTTTFGTPSTNQQQGGRSGRGAY